MNRQSFLVSVALVLVMLVAACGTIAAPQYEVDQQSTENAVVAQSGVTEVATDIPLPTATTEPTLAPTDVPPTAVPTEIPATEVPTEAPTEAPAESSAPVGQDDPMYIFVSIANPSRGEQLFIQTGCNACHNVADETMLVGPGLYNVINRAGTRVAGEGPYTYLYHSINQSQAFVVEGYPAGVMPTYQGILSDADIYDLVAYLSTLHD